MIDNARGVALGVFVIFLSLAVAVTGLYLWLRDMDTAQVIGVGLACVACYAAGLFTSRLVREPARVEPKLQAEVIDGDYTPHRELLKVAPGHWQLSTAEQDAQEVYRRCYLQHTPATREAIRAATGIMSNQRIAAALNVLAGENLVTPEASAGKQRQWIYNDD